MAEYQHKSVTKLSELYEKHKKGISAGAGMMSLMWRALSPSIPEILVALDSDEELLGKIKTFLNSMLEAMKEDALD